MSAHQSASGDIARITAESPSPLAMATLVSATGSTPKAAGAKMFLDAAGAVTGTVTIGGCVDARVLDAAARVLEGAPPALLDLSLGDDEAWELGLTCGGAVSVFVEPITEAVRAPYRAARTELAAGRWTVIATVLDADARRVVVSEQSGGALHATDRLVSEAHGVERSGVSRRIAAADLGTQADVFFDYLAPSLELRIVGAGEVARALVPIARELGMRTVVIDSRERFASRERFPAADAIHVGIPSEVIAALPPTARSAVVLVAHDYKFELPVLRHALRGTAPYIGMLGGKRRGATIRQMLLDDGFSAEDVARIRSPIGLDIGARSTAEIALSIVAELVKLDAGKSRPPTSGSGRADGEHRD